VRGEAAVTPARSLLIAVVAVVLLIDARPTAVDEQFPRGLMSSAPRTPGGMVCTIETRPLSFAPYDPLADMEVDAVAQIIYTCDTGNEGGGGGGRGRGGGGGGGGGSQGIRIEIDQGANNSFDPRAMVGSGFERLEYNIYLDATHRTIWGTGVGSTQVYIDTHPPNRTPVIVPAFGRIFARQDAIAGIYADSVRVGIVF